MKEHTSRPFKSGKKPYTPMGEQRYQELMSQLRESFARIDDGEEMRRIASEREQQRLQWLARRDSAIVWIREKMVAYGLTEHDLA